MLNYTNKIKSTPTHKTARTVRILLSLFLLLFITLFPRITTEAASLKIRYGGKDYAYTGAQAGATLEGKKLNLKGTPGILTNDTCMLPLNEVFKTALGVRYSYNRETKALVIKQNDITIRMTLNSRTAYVNNKIQTMDMAPMQIKFYAKGATKIFVPARFVAESLGYTYTWNSTTKCSDMKKPFVIRYEKDWTVYKGIQGKVTFDGMNVDLKGMPGVIINNTALLPANTVFKSKLLADYTYDKVSKQITISQNDVTIVMTINSKEAFVNDIPVTMGTAARVIYNQATNKSFIMVPGEFVATNLGYHYSWNEDIGTSVITMGARVYFSQSLLPDVNGQTSITTVEASCTDKTDILMLEGTAALDVTVVEINEEQIQLIISNAFTDIEGFSTMVNDSYYLKGVTLESNSDSIIITIDKDSNCNYYTQTLGKKFEFVLSENADVEIEKSDFQMKLVLPKGISIEDITTEDLYYMNRFIVTVPGDQISYFADNPIQYSNNVVDNISIEINPDGNTDVVVFTNRLQGYKLVDCDTFTGVKIGEPNAIYSKIIVLDAGHGGKDNGTSKSGTLEKTLNHTIIYDLAKELFNSPDSDIKAYWTRYDDTFIPLDGRAAFANTIGADLFVSLHMNSATSTANGLEIYYSTDNKSTLGKLNSKTMATMFYDQMIRDLSMGKRGVKSAGFVVVKKNTVPSILIELGFLSNSGDYKKLTDPEFQGLAAQSIYNAAVAVFDSYPTGR